MTRNELKQLRQITKRRIHFMSEAAFNELARPLHEKMLNESEQISDPLLRKVFVMYYSGISPYEMRVPYVPASIYDILKKAERLVCSE